MYANEKLIFASGGRSNYRIPSMIVTNNGTVLAFCNDRKDTLSDAAQETSLVLCKKKPGEDWGEVEELVALEGWACGIGSAVYDAEVGKAFIFGGRNPISRHEFKDYTPEEKAEMAAQAAKMREEIRAKGMFSSYKLVSTDNGETWTEIEHSVAPVEQLHWDGKTYKVGGGTHGAAHGIQLKHGQYKGRLLCAARTGIGSYTDWTGLQRVTYNNAIYSDDHGDTWKTANCVQVGTGEGTLIENADGTVTYNSRAYFKDQKRYLATSTDGGATYQDFRTDDFLIEEKNIGCNASFIRVELDEIKDKSLLPEGAEDVTVFCNPRAETRSNMCACVSFDSGKTWKHVKVINPGMNAYSSLVWNPVPQTFVLIYEKGEKNCYSSGIAAIEFDLEWLLSE